MKKYFLLLLLLLPVGVFAEDGLYPAEYTIQTKVNLQGKELEEGEFTFEFANDLGYEVKEEKNSLIFTHNENKSTISIYTMDTATSSIIMKEKDF